MIIVTGANGFIGSVLVWELNRSGRSDIVCVDSVGLDERNLLKGLSYEKFLKKDEIWALLEKTETIANCETIFHMGACSSTTEMNVAFLEENNVEYTRRLWQWCTRHKKKFIYASSGAVYGDGAQGFDDASPSAIFKPLNPYGESKAAFDRWAEKESAQPPLWLGLRFFNVFGPNEHRKGSMASVVYKAFLQIRQENRLSLFRSHHADYEDGKQMRDFVYVKDVTRWMRELASQPNVKSGIYNMGFGKARTWLDLASAVFRNMDRPMEINWIDVPETMRPRYQYFTEAKMTRLLGMGLSSPQWPLEKAIDDYVRNHLLAKVAKPGEEVESYL